MPPLHPPQPQLSLSHPNLQSPPHNHRSSRPVIDLTADDSPLLPRPPRPPSGSQPLRSTSPSPPTLDDDIIFTGELRAPVPSPPSSRQPDPAQPSSIPSDAQSGSRGTLTGRMAALTAGIYAGFFSSNPSRSEQAPAQGSSTITIRDSPPLQVRRSRPPPMISFGGGGRISGGQFSGLLATSLNSLRGFATGRGHAASESLEEMFTNWSRGSRPQSAEDGSSLLDPAHNLLLTPDHQFFAAIYDFDGAEPRQAYTYKESDSHPLKLMPGFSKEIVPLDREILTLDSDSASEGQMVKQELRPVCAACDRDLLMSQDSSVDGSAGRRPWILACGHVVDSSCLESAKARARELKRLQKTRKVSSSRANASTARAKAQRFAAPSSMSESILSGGPKRRKLSTSQPPALSSLGPALDRSPSICAQRRKERAEAREARKSIDHLHTLPGLSSHAKTPSGLPDGEREPASEVDCNSKGKGKADEESSAAALVEIPEAMGLMKPCEVVEVVEEQSWMQCPVKGCTGAKGDVLASVGSKKGPWEMFV